MRWRSRCGVDDVRRGWRWRIGSKLLGRILPHGGSGRWAGGAGRRRDNRCRHMHDLGAARTAHAFAGRLGRRFEAVPTIGAIEFDEHLAATPLGEQGRWEVMIVWLGFPTRVWGGCWRKFAIVFVNADAITEGSCYLANPFQRETDCRRKQPTPLAGEILHVARVALRFGGLLSSPFGSRVPSAKFP
jgi:hypothetical protein